MNDEVAGIDTLALPLLTGPVLLFLLLLQANKSNMLKKQNTRNKITI